MRTLIRLLLKGVKFFGIFVLAVFIIVNLFIVLSGRFYLYKGIANTYLIGKMGPDIYDLDVFPYSTIQKSEQAFQWKTSDQYNTARFTAAEEKLNKKLKTTAFLVFKGNELVFEKYYEKHAVGTVSNSFSASKTVVALLVGIALDEGKIKSLDERVGNYIPSFKKEDKETITIRHLLQMASGLDWQESGKNPLSENAESYYGTDLYGLVSRQHGVEAPGEKFNYQSGNSQLLGFVVEKATGMSLSKYAELKLWTKLGAESDAFWSLDKADGAEKAFCCMYATAQDFGRIGRLILQKGEWNGKQIISKSYMEEMLSDHAPTTAHGFPNTCYKMHIWSYNDGEDDIYYCRGILGQYIAVIPAKDIVFVRFGHLRGEKLSAENYKARKKKGEKVDPKDIDQPQDFLQYIKTVKRIAGKV